MAGASVVDIVRKPSDEHLSAREQLQHLLEELHSKDQLIAQLARERDDKEATLRALTSKLYSLRGEVTQLVDRKNESIAELTKELGNLQQENTELILKLEAQEKRYRQVYATIQEKMQIIQRVQEEQDEELRHWRQLMQKEGKGSPESAELLRAQAEQICTLKLQLEDTIRQSHLKSEAYEVVSSTLQQREQEIDNLKKQFFFALAVGLKLTFMQEGKECNVSTVSLWEECQRDKVGFVSWRLWIQEKLSKAAK